MLHFACRFACLCMTALPALQDGSNVPQNTIDRAISELDRRSQTLQRISFEAYETRNERGGLFPDWTWIVSLRYNLVRHEDQWRFRYREYGINYRRPDARTPFDNEYELLYGRDKNHYGIICLHKDDVQSVSKANSEQRLSELITGPISPVGNECYVFAWLEDSRIQGKIGYAIQDVSRPVFGYPPYTNELTISQLLKSGRAKVRQSLEDISGRPTLVVDVHDKFGHHTLWLDPKAGFAARRTKTVKAATDLFQNEDERVKDQKTPKDPKSRMPLHGVISFTTTSDIELGNTDDVFIPSKCLRLDLYRYDNGDQFEVKRSFVYSKASFTPSESDLGITLHIPNGSEVNIQNGAGIQAEWQNGSVVKVYDKSIIKVLADLGPPKERGFLERHKFYIYLANTIALAIVFLIIVLNRSKKRRRRVAGEASQP